MKPGRELDALIAEKIFGLEVVKKKGGWSIGEPDWQWERFEGSVLYNPLPNYSEDITEAFKVVEKIYFDFCLTTNTDQPCGPEDCWQADFFAGEYKAWGCSPAHAICLAALKTKEYSET